MIKNICHGTYKYVIAVKWKITLAEGASELFWSNTMASAVDSAVWSQRIWLLQCNDKQFEHAFIIEYAMLPFLVIHTFRYASLQIALFEHFLI